MELLKQLEPIRVLELEVDTKYNDLKESMEHTPRLRLEYSRDKVSCVCVCVVGDE